MLWTFVFAALSKGAARTYNTKIESPYSDHYPCLAIMVCHFAVVLALYLHVLQTISHGNYKYVMSTNIIRKKYIRNHNWVLKNLSPLTHGDPRQEGQDHGFKIWNGQRIGKGSSS